MLVERIEGKWIEAFRDVFRLCAVIPGEVVAILSETQSRRVLVELSELALHQLGARAFHVQLVSPPVAAGVPVIDRYFARRGRAPPGHTGAGGYGHGGRLHGRRHAACRRAA